MKILLNHGKAHVKPSKTLEGQAFKDLSTPLYVIYILVLIES